MLKSIGGDTLIRIPKNDFRECCVKNVRNQFNVIKDEMKIYKYFIIHLVTFILNHLFIISMV